MVQMIMLSYPRVSAAMRVLRSLHGSSLLNLPGTSLHLKSRPGIREARAGSFAMPLTVLFDSV